MHGIKSIETKVILPGRSINRCWFSPVVACVPTETGKNKIIVAVFNMTSDDFGDVMLIQSMDNGETWSAPSMTSLPKIEHPDAVFEQLIPGPLYHEPSGKVLGIGQTLFSSDTCPDPFVKGERIDYVKNINRKAGWGIWDVCTNIFQKGWKAIEFNEEILKEYRISLVHSAQSHILNDGRIMWPGLFRKQSAKHQNYVVTILLNFDGQNLSVDEIGPAIAPDILWHVEEPSICQFENKYFMTLRSQMQDYRMYKAVSDDGMNWYDAGPWRWDDGSEVETENTQQHFLAMPEELYLVYTRRSELSNGVARSRAPLFIAKVDTDSQCLIRETEKIVFPEKGARMGNFWALPLSGSEALIFTGEWQQGYVEGHSSEDKFGFYMADNDHTYNYIRLAGDLLLARVILK